MRPFRWPIFIIVAVTFIAVALSSDIYNLTSPPALSWHIVLRKVYSIVAFAIVGATFIWASGASMRTTALVVALYSGAIEIGQYYIDHSKEGPIWNAVDVLCGGVGGALGSFIPWARAKSDAGISAVRSPRRSR